MTFADVTFDDDWPTSTRPRPRDRERDDPWLLLQAKLEALEAIRGLLRKETTTIPDQGIEETIDWDDALARCKDRGGIVGLVRLSGLKATADRVAYLLEVENDLDEDEAPIAMSSLKGFADFLRKERRLEPPSEISISPDGSLIAEWHYGPNRHLAIKFLDEEMARFASIAPSRLEPAGTRSINGTAQWAEVVNSLSPIRVARWRRG